jgi:Carboxypeptidase regulatory-like domain
MTDSRAVVSGRVLDAQGEPVSGARVFVLKAPGPVPDIALLTGDDGRFTLSLPMPGRYELACDSDVHGTTSAPVEVGASHATLDLQYRSGSHP